MNPGLDSATELFGPYEVFDRLGMGGMAMVHRAKKRGPEGFEQNVALKRMLTHLAEDTSFVESFVREAKVASLLVHPNIAQVYDFGRIRGVYYIAMELVTGFDVRRLLRYANRSNEPIPMPVILAILGEIADALDFAHSFVDEHGQQMNIVHRDVSPSNLIVAHTGHLKVIDFGIAKASTRQLHTESGKVKGKLGYMSPEAALGMSSGPISDIFSTGVVAWELVTATPLFTTRTDMETMQRIREGTIRPPSTINPACPPELDHLILAALEREPERRLPTASLFRGGLDDIIARHGIAVSARAVVEWMTRFAQPEDLWARGSHRSQLPIREQPRGEQMTSVERGSRSRRGSEQPPRARSPSSRPVALRRSAEHIALATEIWGEDQSIAPAEPGPDFNIANLRASSPVALDSGPLRPPIVHESYGSVPSLGAPRVEASTTPFRKTSSPSFHTQVPALPGAADARVTELPLQPRPSTPPSTPPPFAQSAPLPVLRVENQLDPRPHSAPHPTLHSASHVMPPPAERRSKWPFAVLALLAIVAGVLIAVLVTRGGDDKVAVVTPDAAISVSQIEPDAATKAETKIEPGTKTEPADANEPADIEMPKDPKDPKAPRRKPPIRKPPKIDRTEPPKVDPPKVDPKIDPPKVDPKIDPPKIDPKIDPPKVDPPKIDPPKDPPKPKVTPLVSPGAVTKVSGDIPTLRSNTSDDAITVKLCIDESGKVTSVSSKNAPADVVGELQRGLSSWRYKPYLRDGKASAVCFPFSMRLVKRN